MSDVFDTTKRSEVMSRIRGKGNKTTELALAAAFRKAGIKGWRRHLVLKLKPRPKRSSSDVRSKLLVVKPDFVFRQAKLAVFVDGCFWHQCPLHSTAPESNRAFWELKLTRNTERDQVSNRTLRAAGWRVLRVWEHALNHPDQAAARVKRWLLRQHARSGLR